MGIFQGLIDIGGWIGAALMISGYFLTQFNIAKTTDKTMILMNLIGASLMALYTYSSGAMASTVVNVSWATIALAGLATVGFITKN